MDCCGSSKPKKDKDVKENPTEKETSKDVKAGHMGHENSPAEKEQVRGGGCCGGGGTKDMVLHFVLMIIVFLIISYFLKR